MLSSNSVCRHMLSVHSVAAFETVEQVYQASQASEREQEQEQDPGSRVSVPQFASLVQVRLRMERLGALQISILLEMVLHSSTFWNL